MLTMPMGGPGSGVGVAGKAKAVAIGVAQQHFAGAPFGVMRGLLDRHVGGTEGAVQAVDVVDDEVHRAADLAVAAVFGEEDRLAVAGELGEQREAGFEAVFPVDHETQPLHVERQGGIGVAHAQLRDDGLGHGESSGTGVQCSAGRWPALVW
ncbi:hypothetical protein Ddc_23182 [Ditylenchus destructor]|nr:hypothetical protein Ddc_23182 [Ditylenchus destructor]